MTDGKDSKESQAQSTRELAIRLLFEPDPEQQEALVEQLAELANVRRSPSRAA